MRAINGFSRPLSCVAVVAGLMMLPGQAAANLLSNAGFETGDFSGWTQIGNTGFSGVQCPGGVPEGNCDAFFGPIGSLGGIQQTIATQIGAMLNISFVFQPDGGSPSEFKVIFGGQTLLDLVNPGPSGFQTFNFTAQATGASTALSFEFRDDPGFLFLDNVSVVPEPGTLALLGLGFAGIGWAKRRKLAR